MDYKLDTIVPQEHVKNYNYYLEIKKLQRQNKNVLDSKFWKEAKYVFVKFKNVSSILLTSNNFIKRSKILEDLYEISIYSSS